MTRYHDPFRTVASSTVAEPNSVVGGSACDDAVARGALHTVIDAPAGARTTRGLASVTTRGRVAAPAASTAPGVKVARAPARTRVARATRARNSASSEFLLHGGFSRSGADPLGSAPGGRSSRASRSAGERGLHDDHGSVVGLLGRGLRVDRVGLGGLEVAGAAEAGAVVAAVGAGGRVADLAGGAVDRRRHGRGEGDGARERQRGDGDGAGDAGRELHGGSSWVVAGPGDRFGRPDPRPPPRLRPREHRVTSATSPPPPAA